MKLSKFSVVGLAMIISLFIIAPTSVSAAWWNPVSWFGKEKSVQNESTDIGESEEEMENESNDNTMINRSIEKQTNSADYTALINQITALSKENANLRQQLNVCLAPANPNTSASNAVKVIDATEIDKQNKLKRIDQEILAIIEEQLDETTPGEAAERCEFLSDRITKYKFSTSSLAYQEHEANCKTKPDVSRINELLGAYRIVDEKMIYKDIPASFDELRKLKSYLMNTYIEYR